MVGIGTLLALVALIAAWLGWRRRPFAGMPWFLRLLVFCAPLGFAATEAGWVVTEVGRQPWIIYGIMRTSEAVTPVQGLWLPSAGFAVLYVVLFAVTVRLLRRHVFLSMESADA
jgi:cytochrome bd ubiquinol oxidase subunit I